MPTSNAAFVHWMLSLACAWNSNQNLHCPHCRILGDKGRPNSPDTAALVIMLQKNIRNYAHAGCFNSIYSSLQTKQYLHC